MPLESGNPGVFDVKPAGPVRARCRRRRTQPGGDAVDAGESMQENRSRRSEAGEAKQEKRSRRSEAGEAGRRGQGRGWAEAMGGEAGRGAGRGWARLGTGWTTLARTGNTAARSTDPRPHRLEAQDRGFSRR